MWLRPHGVSGSDSGWGLVSWWVLVWPLGVQVRSTATAAASIASATALTCGSLSGTAREPHAEREAQVLHRSQDLRGRTTAMGAAGLLHAREQGVHGGAVGVEVGAALGGDRMQFLAAVTGGDRYVAEFLEHGQRGVDHAGAGAVGAADALLDRLDDLVAVARLLGDQVEDDQAEVAMGEEAARGRSGRRRGRGGP